MCAVASKMSEAAMPHIAQLFNIAKVRNSPSKSEPA
jgi:hypothetical protein